MSRPEIEAVELADEIERDRTGDGKRGVGDRVDRAGREGVVGRVDREAEQALNVVGVFAELAQIGGFVVEIGEVALGRRTELGGQVGEDGRPGGIRDIGRLEARFQRRPVHRRAVAGQDLQAELDRGALREGGRFVRDQERALETRAAACRPARSFRCRAPARSTP